MPIFSQDDVDSALAPTAPYAPNVETNPPRFELISLAGSCLKDKLT